MSDVPTPIQNLVDAVNAGDTDAFLACFTTAGVVNDWGRPFSGHPAIRGWSDNELIGKNATLDVTDVSGSGAHVTVIAQVGGGGFNGPSTFTFDVQDELIALMAITA